MCVLGGSAWNASLQVPIPGRPQLGGPVPSLGQRRGSCFASEFPTSGLEREAWPFCLVFPGWGVAAKLEIPGLGGILSESHQNNQLCTMQCLGLSVCALKL